MVNKFIEKLSKLVEEGNQGSKYESPLISEKVWVSSGIPELDWTLRTLGFKKGFVEIAGLPRAGKTTIGLQIVANYQAKYENAVCIFMLSEQRIDDSYAVRLGVDMDRLIKIKEKTLEGLFYTLQDKMEELTKMWDDAKLPGNPKIIVLWDSISATISESELTTFKNNAKVYKKQKLKEKTESDEEEEDDDSDDSPRKLKHAKMAAFAKNARDFTKAIHAQLYSNDIIFICLNHLTDNLNSPHGGKTSTGGSWRNYFCYIRLEMQPDVMTMAKHRIGTEQWGQMTNVKIIKNDFGGYSPISLQLCLGYGFTLTTGDIEYAVKKKLIEKKGEKGYSFLNGKLSWNSTKSFYELYRSENKLMKILHRKIIELRHKDVLATLKNQ